MFKTGDHVIWLSDGDIGIVAEVVLGRDEDDAGEYFIEWLISPEDSGWHNLDPSALQLLGVEP